MTDQELFDKLVQAADRAQRARLIWELERLWLQLKIMPYPADWVRQNVGRWRN